MSERRSEKSPERLDRLERWMLAVVSHPGGVDAGLGAEEARRELPAASKRLEDVVTPSKALTSSERLEVYANMYFWRLIDVLAEDYPTVRHILGVESFSDLATAYVIAHPSRHYSLSMLGRVFPDYVREEARNVPHRAFVAEVAGLERSLGEVFDAPRAPQLHVDDLLAVPQERWGAMRFSMIPALRLHAFRYPVNDYYQAVRDELPTEVPSPLRSWLVVFRRDFRVWRMSLSEERYVVLEALAHGRRLAEAVEAAADLPGLAPEELLASVGEWFRSWAGEGLFAGVEPE